MTAYTTLAYRYAIKKFAPFENKGARAGFAPLDLPMHPVGETFSNHPHGR